MRPSIQRSTLLAAIVLATSACSQGDGGELASGIVSGQNQVVTAGAAQLTDPVIQRIVRTRDNRIVMYRVKQGSERLLDMLVPRAYAQGTVVNGSPVPGAVVCVSNSQGLEAFTPCTNTDANGQATFFFTPSTVAGEHTAEIRGTVGNEPAVFDTAVAIVEAGPPNPTQEWHWGPIPSPATLYAESVEDAYRNAVPYRIVSDGRLTVLGATVGTADARTVTFTADMVDPATMYGPVEFRGAGGELVARAKYRIVIADDVPAIEWHVYGLNLTP